MCVRLTVCVVLWVLLPVGRRVGALLRVAHLAEGGGVSLPLPPIAGGQARAQGARATVISVIGIGVIGGIGVVCRLLLLLFFWCFFLFRPGAVVWDEQGDGGASRGPVNI